MSRIIDAIKNKAGLAERVADLEWQHKTEEYETDKDYRKIDDNTYLYLACEDEDGCLMLLSQIDDEKREIRTECAWLAKKDMAWLVKQLTKKMK